MHKYKKDTYTNTKRGTCTNTKKTHTHIQKETHTQIQKGTLTQIQKEAHAQRQKVKRTNKENTHSITESQNITFANANMHMHKIWNKKGKCKYSKIPTFLLTRLTSQLAQAVETLFQFAQKVQRGRQR